MPIIFFSTANRLLLISFAIADCLQRNVLQDEVKLIAGEDLAFGIQVKGRHFKSALLQSAVEDREAAVFIDQQLQTGAGAIDEDKRIPLRYLTAQFVA